MPPLDEPGPAGCSSDAAVDAVQAAAALAVELRGRLDALARGAWDGYDHRTVLDDALAAIGALRDAVPGLRSVRSWSEVQARGETVLVGRRALAAVRALEELARRGRVLVAAPRARV